MTRIENPLSNWPKLQPWAVVGVSDDPQKFGYKIYLDLKAAGYEVYGVNPKLTTIAGDPCYATLAALPKKPAVVDMVVPPAVSLQVVEDCKAAGIERIWFQPGSDSPEAIKKALSYGIHVISDACIMIQKVLTTTP